MTTVRFNDHNEFIIELQKEFGKYGGDPVDSPILRLTCLPTSIPSPPSVGDPVGELSVVATIKDTRGDIIRLDRYCGQIWGAGAQDKATQDTMEEISGEIEKAAKELGLEIRGGTFEGE